MSVSPSRRSPVEAAGHSDSPALELPNFEAQGLDPASPLAVAYAAYRRTAASEREVDLAVARVRARLQGRPRRLRLGPVLAALVAFAGAAYAAGSALSSGASSSGDSDSSPAGVSTAPTRTPDAPGRQQAAAVGVAERARTASPPLVDAATPAATTPERVQAPPEIPATAKPNDVRRENAPATDERGGAAAWAVVAEAMAAKDYARAEAALSKLASSDAGDTADAATRHKALLGLAQLALGRGDCVEASRLARRILQDDPSAPARRRSEEVLTRCAAP